MAKADNALFQISGPAGTLPVKANDRLGRQLGMLFEHCCLGRAVQDVVKRFRYSRQRFFQIQQTFIEKGSSALLPQKTGPKSNRLRSSNVIAQVIRHKFLDPDVSADVIAQKLRQCRIQISKRSVQRTIAEFGLQKKTLSMSTRPESIVPHRGRADKGTTAKHSSNTAKP
jgi:hypothetical protein